MNDHPTRPVTTEAKPREVTLDGSAKPAHRGRVKGSFIWNPLPLFPPRPHQPYPYVLYSQRKGVIPPENMGVFGVLSPRGSALYPQRIGLIPPEDWVHTPRSAFKKRLIPSEDSTFKEEDSPFLKTYRKRIRSSGGG